MFILCCFCSLIAVFLFNNAVLAILQQLRYVGGCPVPTQQVLVSMYNGTLQLPTQSKSCKAGGCRLALQSLAFLLPIIITSDRSCIWAYLQRPVKDSH